MGKTKEHVPLGYLGDLSAEQSQCLSELRAHLTANHPSLDLGIHDDWNLLRYCRARKFKIKDVILMYDNYLTFSQEHDIYNILKTDDPKAMSEIYHAYPQGMYSTSKSGHPVCIEIWEGIDHGMLLKNYTEEQIIHHFVRWCLKMIHAIFYKCSEKMGRPCDGFYLILDFKGVGFTKIMGGNFMKLTKLLTRATADNFPELMIKTYFINVPMMFSLVWNIVKWWIDDKTKAKIGLYGSSYKKHLLVDIDADQLPERLGGTCQAEILEGHVDKPWRAYVKDCHEKLNWFPDGVVVSNPMKWQQRQQRDGGEKLALGEEEWYDWMESSEAHKIDEQIEIQMLSASGINEASWSNGEFHKWDAFDTLGVSPAKPDLRSPHEYSESPSQGSGLSHGPKKAFAWDDFANDDIGIDAADNTPMKKKNRPQASIVRSRIEEN